jgi:hypothetical protein
VLIWLARRYGEERVVRVVAEIAVTLLIAIPIVLLTAGLMVAMFMEAWLAGALLIAAGAFGFWWLGYWVRLW